MYKVIETQGRPHTLTQKDGKTFRLFARQEKIIEESLISPEFYAEQAMGNIVIIPMNGENKNKKGGTK